MESSITPRFHRAARLYAITYGRIPGICADLKVKNDSQLFIKVYPAHKSILRLGWTVALLFGSLVVGLLLSFILLKALLAPQNTQLEVIEIVFCLLYISCIILLLCCLTTFFKNRHLTKLLNDFANHGLGLGIRVLQPVRDTAGYLMICMATGMIVFMMPLPVLLVYRHLDPMYIIARELFFPPLIYWNAYHISGTVMFSLITCVFGSFVIVKFIFLLIFVFVMKINHVKNYAFTFLNLLNYNEYHIINVYIHLRIFVILFQIVISEVCLYVVVWSVIVLTIGAWLFVNGFSQLPVLILLATISAFVGGFLMAVCVFETLINARLYSGELVKKKQSQFHGHNRSRRNYYLNIRWRAQKELRLYCGSHFAFTKEALANYLTVLNTNITNAVLLVRP